ncbi:hypothetical protein SUGI_1044950 [Cryptomeria japonica]|uniref:uncharacterized protein LOC131075666 isoform X6 n=1 Tax=Cryptomeria japonica TaxID=3369 RepID=UPI002414C8E0|nr:uncharacterized protein LOC131075666 isoform X6 [Cryptomeria japonica]GLJ49385.1 hypothetical protein SUGI_1044950 [Cryptomeria japonica]
MSTSFSRKKSAKSAAADSLKRFLHKEECRLPSAYLDSFKPTKKESKHAKKAWEPFSQVSPLSRDLYQFQLVGSHPIGPRTCIETLLQGTKIQLEELRLTLLHTFAASQHAKESKFWKHGQITIFAGTDLNLQHRVSMESILGSEEKGLTFTSIVSSDFGSGVSWGFANSYRPFKKSTFFTRFTCDETSGKRIILQAVQKINDKNMLSPICAVTLGNQLQAGISWTRQFNSGIDDTLQVKALCNREGSFSFNVKAQVGDVR